MQRQIKNSKHLVKAISSVVYHKFPSRKLTVIGVTGTDGKTTTCSLLHHILKTAGKKVAMITTLGAVINEKEIDTGLHVTTPGSLDLQRLIRRVVNAKCEYLVLETTSHGLDQHRVWGVKFSVGVITNITHEHLDYHGSYQNYLKAKAKLLKGVKYSVLNKDDRSYDKLLKFAGGKVITYGKSGSDYELSEVRGKIDPSKVFSMHNALAAYCVGRILKIPKTKIFHAFESFKGVRGRLERINTKRGFQIVVDFAHTPNALRYLLIGLRKEIKKRGRLIVVFGCAGERDAFKRPLMADIATRLSDISVFTAEDPRKEDIKDIFKQMISGVDATNVEKINLKEKEKVDKNVFLTIADRGKAISYAINHLARKGDVVAICGKGHEKSINIGGKEYFWSDQKAVKHALRGKIFKSSKIVG